MFAGWMDDLPKQATAFIYNFSSLHQSCQQAAQLTQKTLIKTCLAETFPHAGTCLFSLQPFQLLW